VFQKFNIEVNSKCAKDWLLVGGPVKKYGKAKVCGSNVPAGFSLISKGTTMTLKFHSNKKTNKSGFSAVIVAQS